MIYILVITEWVNGVRHVEGNAFRTVEEAESYTKDDPALGWDIVKINE